MLLFSAMPQDPAEGIDTALYSQVAEALGQLDCGKAARIIDENGDREGALKLAIECLDTVRPDLLTLYGEAPPARAAAQRPARPRAVAPSPELNMFATPSTGLPSFDGFGGQPVYSEQDCIGAVVAGVCRGSVLPQGGGPQKRCYGAMVGGICTGPMF